MHTENGDERSRAKEVLEEAGATDVSSTSEAKCPQGVTRLCKESSRPEFTGEVTRGSSDASAVATDEVDDARVATNSDRSAVPTSSTRRPL